MGLVPDHCANTNIAIKLIIQIFLFPNAHESYIWAGDSNTAEWKTTFLHPLSLYLQSVKHPQLNKGSSAQHNRTLENSMHLLPPKVSRLGDTEEEEPREPWGLWLQSWLSDSGN